MELEFDKEIDALLRKAKRGSPASAVAPVASGHLDADELAAFAENALPDRTRVAYIAHLADCDTCRTMLSGFVITAPEKAAAAAAFAAQPAPVAPSNVPWWRRLFSGPNLAYTMGGLVVLFSGFVGLLVYQNQQATQGSRSAQVAESIPTPSSESEAPKAFSNATAANTAANSNTASPVESVTKTGVAVGSTSPGTEQTEQQTAGQRPDTGNEIASAKPADQPAENPAAAPPPTTKEESPAVADRDVAAEKQPELDKSKDDRIALADEAKKKVAVDNKALREAPAKAATLSRSAGPRQQQANAQSNVNQEQANRAAINGRNVNGLAVGGGTESRRSVGGKTFEMRGGIWYDVAYHGGVTKDVKRGTDKFLKLDAGLRNIANSLGGTVVVVWGGKAYKIK